MWIMILPLISALHLKMSEFFRKKFHIGSSWKRSCNEKWFLIFLPILKNVEKLKILTFARINTFIKDKE
jgi:hypothetical protein